MSQKNSHRQLDLPACHQDVQLTASLLEDSKMNSSSTTPTWPYFHLTWQMERSSKWHTLFMPKDRARAKAEELSKAGAYEVRVMEAKMVSRWGPMADMPDVKTAVADYHEERPVHKPGDRGALS